MCKIRRTQRMLLLTGIIISLNILAWMSPAFCDFYVSRIHPFCLNTYARVIGWIPFSVGEWMLLAGILVTAAAFAAVIFFLFAYIKGKGSGIRQEGKAVRRSAAYLAFYAEAALVVMLIMTCNCLIAYHCTPLEEKYHFFPAVTDGQQMEQFVNQAGGNQEEESMDQAGGNQMERTGYTAEELGRMRDYLVHTVNRLAEEIPRDAQELPVFTGNLYQTAAESMRRLGVQWEQLEGYYPKAKELRFSGFFSQQRIKGYFFPFSMEANYNGMMQEIHRPATICHEYAHLKGFLYEDEANMIGFLACLYSGDPYFCYSGYLSVLYYVDNAFYEAVGKNSEQYYSHVRISDQVREDNDFLTEKSWQEVEERAVLRTEVVHQASTRFTEAALTMNGVKDGMQSYGRVVDLLLKYYDTVSEILSPPQE